MSILTRSLAVAAMLASGGAMLAYAQGTPAPTLPGAGAEAAERTVPAEFRGARDDHRGRHGGRGERGALLGAFGPAGGEALFAAADADGDGSLTQVEVDAYLASRVEGADGALGLEEFAPLYFEQVRPRMVDAFQALDADGSGEVTAEELDDRFGGAVARLDRDGDDVLTLQDGRRGRD